MGLEVSRKSRTVRPEQNTTGDILRKSLDKCPTGIRGLDEITAGGLPRGRPTLLCGGAGCGKTLFAIEFLVRGALQFDEPGVFLTFEETEQELAENVASLGHDLRSLMDRKKLALDHIHLDRSEFNQAGDFDLEGLFVRLRHAVDRVGAKRVVLDTIETLFEGLGDPSVIRSELWRLFRWLKDNHLTAIVTGERGDGNLTRQGIEEYVSDCVILLDHRVTGQLATRRLRIVKFRGSVHGTNEYPFLIDERGIVVAPITALKLDYPASASHVSSGVPGLDALLGGKGYFRGTSVLISGGSGTGKTSLSAYFVDAASQRGERSLYLGFEESMSQIQRNMKSIGIDLKNWVAQGLMRFHCARPTSFGLEMHLAMIYKAVTEFEPRIAVIDPITSLAAIGAEGEVVAMLERLVDFLKSRGVTTLMTTLTHGGDSVEASSVGISSLIDTWILLRNLESAGERNRCLYVLKSRGMAHSNQVREFIISNRGVKLVDVCVAPQGVLTGSARKGYEQEIRSAGVAQQKSATMLQKQIARRRDALQARITALQAEFEAEVYKTEAQFGSDAQTAARELEDRTNQAGVRSSNGSSRGTQE